MSCHVLYVYIYIYIHTIKKYVNTSIHIYLHLHLHLHVTYPCCMYMLHIHVTFTYYMYCYTYMLHIHVTYTYTCYIHICMKKWLNCPLLLHFESCAYACAAHRLGSRLLLRAGSGWEWSNASPFWSIYMEVSWNGGTPKWMVCNGRSH